MKNPWEQEYQNPKLLSLGNEPQASVKDFIRWLRKERHIPIESLSVIDLGCGNGRNSLYFAEYRARATGIDISETAIKYARTEQLKKPESFAAQFIVGSIGAPLPFEDETFDLALDVTASNALSESERGIFLNETHRILKPQGYFFVRALCKDGDANAKNLIAHNPGPEKDTYIMPDTHFVERVFSKDDFIALYSPLFDITYLEKETHYTPFNGQRYKRNFWIAYLNKKL